MNNTLEDGANDNAPFRRAKRHKEVARFHQRQRDKDLQLDANRRDNQLFLFSQDTRGGEYRAPAPSRWPPRSHPEVLGFEPSFTSSFEADAKGETLEEWNFEFMFHTSETEREAASAKGYITNEDMNDDDELGCACTHENAIVSSTFFSEFNCETAGPSSTSLMVPCTLDKQPQHIKSITTPLSELPIAMTLATSTSAEKALNSIHVQRVEGVPPIPVDAPLTAGTDLNFPTSNYLSLDSTYNIHQHAPGFVKNERIAMHSMLSTSMRGWKDAKESVLVLSNGDAMRSVFEQAYREDKPFALKAQRFGPILLIDVHSDVPSSVRQMREKALLGKALYRLSEKVLPSTTPVAEASEKEGADSTPHEVSPQPMALTPLRVGLDVARHTQALNRYSQILRWDIDSLEVLVGVDTPIVLDRRSNMEHVLKLEDTSEDLVPMEMQRDLLNCWFDATLANVPQIGIYIHNAGVVQRFEVKKVQELLGLTEGRIATAAMNFTSDVLHWLTQQCVKDDGTYAVLRAYDSNYLELYELPQKHAIITESTYDCPPDRSSAAAAGEEALNEAEALRQRREDQARLNLNLARMCLGLAQHLFHTRDQTKSAATLSLLLRSFVIFLQQGEPAHATERVAEISQMLPILIGQYILQRQLPPTTVPPPPTSSAVAMGSRNARCQNSVCQADASKRRDQAPDPEVYREALLSSARFETRLRQALENPRLDPVVQRKYAGSLLHCSAALCVAVARTLDAFSLKRGACLGISHRSLGERESRRVQHAAAADAEESSAARMNHKDVTCMKDLLQVVVEGLVRLEQLSTIIGAFDMKQADPFGKTTRPCTVLQDDTAKASATEASSLQEVSSSACGPLVDPAADVDVEPLNRSLCELYGDLVLLAMADSIELFTVNVLKEVARHISSREEGKAQQQEQSGVDPLPHFVASKAPPFSNKSASSTLQWLIALAPDPIGLLFTALRFYTKAGNHTKRLLVKTAQVYYYAGMHHLHTRRYTKALESLHRSKSLFKASQEAPEGAGFAQYFASTSLVQLEDVLRALGDLYTGLAIEKMHLALPTASVRITPAQPLSMGLLHTCSEEESQFHRKAIDAYTEGSCWMEKAWALVRYVANTTNEATLSGEPMDRAASARSYEFISEAMNMAEQSKVVQARWQQQLEWETLRLMTATVVGQWSGPLLKQVKMIVQRWSQRLRRGALEGVEDAAAQSSHEVYPKGTCGSTDSEHLLELVTNTEQNLQLALVYCVDVEAQCSSSLHNGGRKKSAVGSGSVMESTRLCIGFVLAALEEMYTRCHSISLSGPLPPLSKRLDFVVRAWKADGGAGTAWMYRMASMIAIRTFKAATVGLAGKRKADAALLFQHVLSLEKTTLKETKADTQGEREVHLLQLLCQALNPTLAW